LFGVVLAGGAAPTLHLKVGPAPLRVGVPVPIVVSGTFSSVRVEAVSPSGRVSPVGVTRAGHDRWRGVFRFNRTGRWRVRAFSGELKVQVSVLIRLALPTPPPEGFGPLGARGCAPPSPRNGEEVFGTTVGGRFWALFGFNPRGTTWASDTTASLDGLVGKEIKIVFKLTAGQPSSFYAISPTGSRTRPVWGPTPHGTSSWTRTGAEWGAGFVFGQVGCWKIHAARGTTSGDIFVDVRS
jgi:hypothetical protein